MNYPDPATVPIGWKGLDTLVLFEAGAYSHDDGTIRVPYRLADGTSFREKVFAGARSWWGPGSGLIPFGLEHVVEPCRRDERCAIVAEGESDALAIRGALSEWRGLPVDVIGLPGAGTWRSDWERHLRGHRAVYVVPDADMAGLEMFLRAKRDVRSARWVRLPAGMDARGVVQSDGGLDMLCDALHAADVIAGLYACLRLSPTLKDARQMARVIAL